MAIILKNSWNVPPTRWGSFADIQYAVKVNAENVYNINPDDILLSCPGFWGMPLVDYSPNRKSITNHGVYFNSWMLELDGGTDYISVPQFIPATGTDPRTFLLLFNPDRYSNDDTIFSYGTDVNGQRWSTRLNENATQGIQGALRTEVGGGYNTSTTNLIGEGFISAACTFNGTTTLDIKHYVKGSLEASSNSGSFGVNTGSGVGLNIGRENVLVPTAFRYFLGNLKDFHVAKVEYTEEQISLFASWPYGLYQKVSRPFYLLPIAATTAPPTTPAPTTVAPTTVAPTTLAPTTIAPTTLSPTTTPVATTPPPTTLAPTTAYPTSAVPTTPSPTSAAPTTLFQTTAGPTTKAPTTVSPTTAAPTTLQPTTSAPTTPVPTTVGPTTVIPTTLAPTTSAPTTIVPTTSAPTTLVPTSPTPTTVGPTTSVPTSVGPTSLAPTTLEPTTLAPTSLAPTTSAPTTPVPTTLAPTSLAPTTIAPTTLAPTTSAPTSLAPTTFLTTLAPTTNIPELICVKNLSSIINLTLDAKSTITKEVTLNGNLC